jgi:hypothetical protein
MNNVLYAKLKLLFSIDKGYGQHIFKKNMESIVCNSRATPSSPNSFLKPHKALTFQSPL